MRHWACIVIVCTSVLAVLPANAQPAPDVRPDFSGNDPHWIEDPITQCWAANPHPQNGETISWSGGCEGGLLTGQGTLTWMLGGRVTGRDQGTFRNGRLTGRGRIDAVDGTSYEGDFPGKGVLTLPDGRKVPARTVRDSSGWSIEEPIPGEEPL